MPSNTMTIVTWVLRILVAAAFLVPAYFKLSGQPMMVDEFNKLGLGSWFMYFTGAVEVIGALLVLNPGTTAWGALLLFCVLIGALIAHLTAMGGDIVHVFVYMVPTAILIYLTRHHVMNAVGARV